MLSTRVDNSNNELLLLCPALNLFWQKLERCLEDVPEISVKKQLDCDNFFLQRECVHASEEYGIYVETTVLFYGFIKAIRIVTMEKFFL